VSGIGGETGLIALVVGLKSKSCVGALKTPNVGPALAAKITWPLGRTAPGASSRQTEKRSRSTSP